MLNQVVIKVFNRFIKASPSSQAELQKLQNQVISLATPLFAINVLITGDGLLELSSNQANTFIRIPLATLSHLIHQEQIRTFKLINIEGDQKLATSFLTAIAKINPSDILYQHNLPILGIFAVTIENFIKQLIEYLKLVQDNAMQSLSQYAQYEIDFITDKHTMEEFLNQVDELNERCQLLAKRLEKLT